MFQERMPTKMAIAAKAGFINGKMSLRNIPYSHQPSIAFLPLKIPQDLSIIGFDNREIASYLPVPLTTIQLPNTEIGHESAKMLLSLAEGRTVDQNCIILPCKLIERVCVANITA